MRITVLGAGNGALAVAGAASLRGHDVRLWDRYLADHPELVRDGAVHVEGAIEGVARVDAGAGDLASAVEGADLIEVVVPGFALTWLADRLGPVVGAGTSVLLHPGGTGGAFEWEQGWREAGTGAGVVVGATETLAYAARLTAPTTVRIHAEKQRVLIAASDPAATPDLHSLVAQVHPQVRAATSMLELALANLNPVIHPPIVLVNAARIERGEAFSLYGEGVGDTAAALIDALDRERLELADAAGVPAETLSDWVAAAYGVTAASTAELFARMDAEIYEGLAAPQTVRSRYLTEDVPLGLDVFAGLGERLGLELPVVRGVSTLAAAIAGDAFEARRRLPMLGAARGAA